MNEWVERRSWEWLYVARDGEILDRITASIGDDVWYVSSSGKQYVDFESAQKAVEREFTELKGQ